ncbi:ABC-F family ATP-binding cassette domain-containing protein [Streptococcus sp. DD12]|uniref:ABC-F family ATP-binding cassette domain-containing protein n=1 Tax=Streptococcus sp. DD12 TaxID=1777880 RepID=UPI0007911093|nr:ABC-F family ATP-binding cassette domain-containing protein [Streptococcus sp. DD12]KXT76480.1 ATPase component of ABC transporter with duplicated ATPase domain [Streptococcus sp. DD12]
MSDFIVEGLTKTVADKTLFDEISFVIHPGDRIGLIGLNGTGKTSLLDVLSGREGFDGDRSPFSLANGYQIAYLTQEPAFDEQLTVLETVLNDERPEVALLKRYETLMAHYEPTKQAELEAVMAQMDNLGVWAMESDVKSVLTRLGLSDWQQVVGDLSGGLRRRVQLAQILLGDADLLLLDEPTNHLDIASIAWLSQYLEKGKRTVLFITHDRYFLDAISTRIFELDQGNLLEYRGNYQDYVRLKAEQDERQAANLHKKKQLYKQELVWMRRQPQARATKQQARIDRFHSLKKDLAQETSSSDLSVAFEASRIGKKVITFDQVSFAYEPEKPLITDFDWLVQAHDRIGIVGENGVGKSSLLHLINGDLLPGAGSITIGETVRIGYFSQQIRGLDPEKRIINALQEIANEVDTSEGRVSVAELLEQFLFPRHMHGSLIGKLSGGEKKRLYLLQILLQKPNVLLLDEPTNDLDIATLTVLENFIQNFQGPVITVSHDRYFLDKVANKILAFEAGQIHSYFGNYTDYLDEVAFQKEQEELVKQKQTPLATEVQERAEQDKAPSSKRKSYMEKQEWATIEEDILALEDQVAQIEAEMQTCQADFVRLGDLQKELDHVNEALLAKYDRYEYLSELPD